jgi:Ca-activated chloride channel family protein
MKTIEQNYFLFLLIYTLFCVSAFAQNDDDLIKVDSSIVVINATITDIRGKPIAGLKQNQFQIFEDGKEQQIDFFETAKTPFAAVILLDTSGSMEERVSLARSAAIQFLDRLRVDDVAAIYNFNSKVSLVQDFSNSRDIYEGIFDLKADGYTALNDAIIKASEELHKRPEKRRAIIVLSDGADTRSKRSAEKALKAANAANATIYTVDMSSLQTNNFREKSQNQGVLKNFAEKTGGKFVTTPGGVALREAFKNIVEELGTQYTLGYQPLNKTKDGKWRTIELKSQKSNLIIRTRKGYYAPKE